MYVNNIKIKGMRFAYEGCHKIYVIENDKEAKEAIDIGYNLYSIHELEDVFNKSCSLKFINSWDCEKRYVKQFEEAVFS